MEVEVEELEEMEGGGDVGGCGGGVWVEEMVDWGRMMKRKEVVLVVF